MPTLLLTRPEAQSRRLVQALATKLTSCPDIVISPMISIALRPEAADLSGVRGVIF
ncbi:uroporphyrinogen-III synthase, partial [Thioclava sp. BHET1]